jgi:phosphohistidine swiveling domain-containing protein
MLQNLDTHKSQVIKKVLKMQPDESLNLMDHIEGKFSQHHLVDKQSKKKLIKAVPVAPGVAMGCALVVKNPKDLQRINPESILICSRMSPVYSIVFQKVQGIISEKGGICSTAATVAREYGLPAVTGAHSAREMISDGDLIRIDGCNGTVQIKAKALACKV